MQNPYLDGNFGPVQEEVTAFDLDVTGSLPDSLNGRYLRIGPNPVAVSDEQRYHWFLGDGMVHGIRLRDGRADWYRNMLATPAVSVRFADGRVVEGTARDVTDASERELVGDVMGAKYHWGGDDSIGLTRRAWCYEVPAIAVEFDR